MMKPEIISWLLEGDPSIRWQVQRDLLNANPAKYEMERKKIAKEGWGDLTVEEQGEILETVNQKLLQILLVKHVQFVKEKECR